MILADDVEVYGGAAFTRGDDPKPNHGSVRKPTLITPIVNNLGDKTLTRHARKHCGNGNGIISLDTSQPFALPEAPVKPIGIIEGGLKDLNVLGKASSLRGSGTGETRFCLSAHRHYQASDASHSYRP